MTLFLFQIETNEVAPNLIGKTVRVFFYWDLDLWYLNLQFILEKCFIIRLHLTKVH